MSGPKGYRHKPLGLGEQLAAGIFMRAITEGRADELYGCLTDGGAATIDMEGPGVLLIPPEVFRDVEEAVADEVPRDEDE